MTKRSASIANCWRFKMGEVGAYWKDAKEDSKHAERRRRLKGDIRGDPDHCDTCSAWHGIGMRGQDCAQCMEKRLYPERLEARKNSRNQTHPPQPSESDEGLLNRLGLEFKMEDDGSKYSIKVLSDYGPKVVDYWTDTSRWRVRGSKAEGFGLHKMVRYFRLESRQP